MSSKEESTVQVTMARDDKKRFDGVAKQLGMTQKAALGQLITWFQAQDPMIRSMVMGHVPEEYAGDIIELMYRRRKAQKPPVVASDVSDPNNLLDTALVDAQQRRPATKHTTRQKRAKTA